MIVWWWCRTVLNNAVSLFDVLPAESSLYDIIAPVGSERPPTVNKDFATLVEQSSAALRFYETVPGLGYDDWSPYPLSFRNTSLDSCAEACYDEYASW